ncbi:MAG: outer membrane beta-barrel protein [Luteitalea sp.]|nr:outer membrane beta-barrel protein [Luteitalea sp.]
MRRLILMMIGVLALTALPTRASADGLVTPFVGWNMRGEGVKNRLHYGIDFGGMANEIIGFEVDFGYSPNFFNLDPEDFADFNGSEGSVTTLMGNVLIGIPLGARSGPQIRPYATGGIGLIRLDVESVGGFFEDASRNDFGLNVGGGAMIFFSPNVGLRGDLRYFRSLNDEDPEAALPVDLGLGDFDFWRGDVGITFRF